MMLRTIYYFIIFCEVSFIRASEDALILTLAYQIKNDHAKAAVCGQSGLVSNRQRKTLFLYTNMGDDTQAFG